MNNLRHVQKALNAYSEQYGDTEFIKVDNPLDEKGVAPVVSFTIQSDPVSEVGVNGVQATDMIKYAKNLIESLDATFPCHENKLTIAALQDAIDAQNERTRERTERGVEGENKL